MAPKPKISAGTELMRHLCVCGKIAEASLAALPCLERKSRITIREVGGQGIGHKTFWRMPLRK